jgi:hypothetical protein
VRRLRACSMREARQCSAGWQARSSKARTVLRRKIALESQTMSARLQWWDPGAKQHESCGNMQAGIASFLSSTHQPHLYELDVGGHAILDRG